MAILLTNGKHYITFDEKGTIIKVLDINQAADFYSVEKAVSFRNRAYRKCKGYYYIDTDTETEEKKKPNGRRRTFTMKQRKEIYRKTEGHCYLCGEFVDFDSFEIEHKIPVSKGGSDELDNVWCACAQCNTIKHDIGYNDFVKKITKIFMYQMGKKCREERKESEWKVLEDEIGKIG